MGIQNSINNMLSTAGVASAGIKHFKMEGLRNELKAMNTSEETLNNMAKIEPKLAQANEDYNAAVELGNELEKSKADMNDWAYKYSRQEADKWIQQYRKQKMDFENRIKVLQEKLNKVDEIGEISKKGWMRK